ncbi:hypothetical protein A9Q84_11305 [Halobacteriovorax marinus]|uniref:Aromatic amino acid beta-eliminating lyase/threonine aldolase domain-containing protein n=1 Tax=Halobacteriovorax marinus TaxID=97084 RepID=A0A1Y5F834_9BACT|nr:hypothetical protein A9Q84_11305 [Halobacteriovorax marinus]
MRKLQGHTQKTIQEHFQELANYCETNDVSYDQYGNGKFLNQFEEEVAELTGMEAAIFMPSGVMAQLIALRIYSDELVNMKVACHPTCHILLHEEDAYELLHGLEALQCGEKDQVITLKDIQELNSRVASLILELPLRHLGGDLPTWDELTAQKTYCKEQGIKLHLDGARLFECENYYQKSVKEIVSGFDSLFLSFYKGFGSTSGSMLLGSEDFISKAKLWLRRHGGNLFQLYPLAIPAKMNFEKRMKEFDQYVLKAKEIAEVLATLPGVKVIPEKVITNMMHLELPQSKETLYERMSDSKENGFDLGMGVWREEPVGFSRVELSIGDAALKLSLDEIVEGFTYLLKK